MDGEILNSLFSGELEQFLEPQVLECARIGTVEEMEAILGLGGNIYATDAAGRNVFHYAAEGANGGMILWLAQQFQELGRLDWRFEADRNQVRPLHCAATNEYFEGIEALISWGLCSLYSNAPDDKFLTPLFYAAISGHASMIRFLLEHGAFVDGGIESGRSETPLHYAVKNGHVESVKVLIDAGAQVGALTRDGLSPLDIALTNGLFRIVRMLLIHIAKVYKGLSPLHHAILGYALGFNGYTQERIIQQLRQVRRIDIRDGYGLTPLEYAQMLQLGFFVEYFQEFERLHNAATGCDEECVVLEEGSVLVRPSPVRHDASF